MKTGVIEKVNNFDCRWLAVATDETYGVGYNSAPLLP